MRTAARTDANHQAIVQALKQVGCRVLDMSRLGRGAPDLLVSCPARGKAPQLVLLEIKTDTGTHTPAQQDFAAVGWPVCTVRSVAEALRAIGVGP
jgi:hypothetical protein